jgi:hypothetical protein
MPGVLAQDIVGSRRDISDVVTMVDAKGTPFSSMVPKDSQVYENLLMEWPVDAEETPGENAVIEATDVTDFSNPNANYGVLNNRMQWMRRTAMVGKLAQNAQNQAGVKDKKARAIAKKIKQLKRDMEIRFCGDTEMVVGTGAVANRTRGIGVWIQNGAQTVNPVPAAYRTPSASISTTATASITDAIVQAVMTSQYGQTGVKKTYSTFCGTTFKGVFKNLQQTQFGSTNVSSSIRTYEQDGASKKIVATVDIYEGDFGTYELIPSLWLAYAEDGTSVAATTACRAYALDMDMWAVRNNQMPQVMPLPDLGGGPRFQVDAITGLVCWSPLGEGKFASTS